MTLLFFFSHPAKKGFTNTAVFAKRCISPRPYLDFARSSKAEAANHFITFAAWFRSSSSFLVVFRNSLVDLFWHYAIYAIGCFLVSHVCSFYVPNRDISNYLRKILCIWLEIWSTSLSVLFQNYQSGCIIITTFYFIKEWSILVLGDSVPQLLLQLPPEEFRVQ